jgi:hypothetical protein
MEAGGTVKISIKLLWPLLALPVLLTGCRSPDIYYWGRYENLVYGMYVKPDKFPAELQARTMEEDLHKAASAHKPVPPGFHAHLGYLYFQMGKTEQARLELMAEKNQFPESAVFMDRMLANLSKQ